MVQALPAPSLRELARPTGVTEGVSFVGSSMPMDYEPAHIGSEIFECLRSSKDTPSVSLSLDSSLREGAGDGCTTQRAARKPQRCGRFSSPLRRAGAIQPGGRKLRRCGRFSSPLRNSVILYRLRSSGDTPSVSPCGLPAPSEREPGMAVPFNRALGNRGVSGDFHRPYGGAGAIHWGKAGSVRMHRPRWVCQGGMKLLSVTWPRRRSGSGFRR